MVNKSDLRTKFDQVLNHPEFREGTHWRRCAYREGQKIIDVGATDNDVYLLIEGDARVIGEVELDGNRQIRPGVCDLKPGDFFGELALFDQEPRSATVEALTDCVGLRVSGDALTVFLQQHPAIGFELLAQLMRVMVERLRTSNKKIFSLLAWGLKAHQIDQHL